MGVDAGYADVGCVEAVKLVRAAGPYPERVAPPTIVPEGGSSLRIAIDDPTLLEVYLEQCSPTTLVRRTTTDALAAATELLALRGLDVAAAERATICGYDPELIKLTEKTPDVEAMMESVPSFGASGLLCIIAQSATHASNSAVKAGFWLDPSDSLVLYVTEQLMERLNAVAIAHNNTDVKHEQHMKVVEIMAETDDLNFFKKLLEGVIKTRHKYYAKVLEAMIVRWRPQWDTSAPWPSNHKWVATGTLSDGELLCAKKKLLMMTTDKSFNCNPSLIPGRFRLRLRAVLKDVYDEVMTTGERAVQQRHVYRASNTPNRHGHCQSNPFEENGYQTPPEGDL
jgi:hypothetical protein